MKIILNKDLCYKTIVNSYNRPHKAAIILLEEIVNQHQLELMQGLNNCKQITLYSPLVKGWRINYRYFKKKYGFTYAKARYALRKLERYKLISRERIFISYKPSTGYGESEIYIRLDLENIKKLLKITNKVPL